MAKLKMSGKVDDPISSDFFELFATISKSKTQTTLESSFHDVQFAFEGKAFTYDGTGTVLSGQLETVKLVDLELGLAAKITDANFNFGIYQDENPLDGENFLKALLSGNDTIIGSKNHDWLEGFGGRDKLFGGGSYDIIDGGAGKDILAGAGGMDIFYFGDNEGNDVVTDFDAVGGGRKQDYFSGGFEGGVEFVKDGKNTLMVMEDGTTITFLGVRFGDLGIEDAAAF